ncbi:glutamate N-acetyltransferase [Mycoemilia scoparia]|uniref:Arginine biosynthesis bifunctional protein ArgJ, mitochondrial n=1 Tax=Mycoemilia scoparia TaxID=417184 RepID=A0A9W8DXN8_9FUNG|nr:glutamate N-acetyltransferase [Mycoemilia scoparia]
MKAAFFSTIAIAAVAYAADSSSESASDSAVPSVSVPEISSFSWSDSPQAKCVKDNCGDANDLSCVAQCYGVPNPNSQMINDTDGCFKKCEGISGAEQCRAACIDQFYNPTTGEFARPTASDDSSASGKSGSKEHKSGDKNKSNSDGESDSEGSATKFTASLGAAFPEKKIKFIPTSGTYPKGFLAGGSHCGVKKNSAPDLAMLFSQKPCTAAAVFTKNQFCAAPVQFDRSLLNKIAESGQQKIRCAVINSGCANAVTGTEGLENASRMANAANQFVSKHDGGSENVSCASLIMSTGVIGQQLPIGKIENGIKDLKLDSTHEAWMRAAIAHMTTDTFPKLRSVEYTLEDGDSATKYRFAGITKGAGMIHPNMATLLGTICTDVSISQPLLAKALLHAVNRSFNSISIDGDTSTNDTISVLANGAADESYVANSGKYTISSENSEAYERFQTALTEFAVDLASLVVRDGEGATKFITIRVKGAKTYDEGKTIASTIATSALVKTAFYGQDANWGRILCAVGYSGVPVDTAKVNLSLIPSDGSKSLPLVISGEPLVVDEVRAKEILTLEDVSVEVDLGLGNETVQMYTCDFSHDYVSINADYRS